MKPLNLLFVLTLLLSCDNKDDLTSFDLLDIKVFNEQIKGGLERNEDWTKDPVSIAHRLFTYEKDPRTLKIELDSPDQNHSTVVHTLEGPYDDSAEGEKRIIKFVKVKDQWTIEEIKVGQKCWDGRGHTNYSGEGCS